jgi:putative endonuclease
VSGGSPRLPWWRRWFGTRSERAAAKHLRRQGYRVVVRNFQSLGGELDLVAIDPERTIVFVEVRSTEDVSHDAPRASVDREKQRRLTRAALAFLKRKRLLGRPARFDVLTLSWPAGARKPTIDHVIGAFEAVGEYQPFT